VERSRNTLLNLFENSVCTGKALRRYTRDIKKGGSAGKSMLRRKWTHQKLLAVSHGSYKIKCVLKFRGEDIQSFSVCGPGTKRSCSSSGGETLSGTARPYMGPRPSELRERAPTAAIKERFLVE